MDKESFIKAKGNDMKVKDYLYQLRVADVKINNKLLELEKLKSLANSLGG